MNADNNFIRNNIENSPYNEFRVLIYINYAHSNIFVGLIQ